MKGLAGLLFLLGVTMAVGAVTDEPVALYLVLALGCFLGSTLLWNVAKRRERGRLAALRNFRPRRERR
jgi:membrane protein DedA with SNARE-associated domain